MTRLPVVAGTFYPLDKEDLFESIHRCFTHPLGPGRFPRGRLEEIETERVECLIVPHAAYEYSGPVAAHSYNAAYNFFNSTAGKKTVIILGPNHYGIGSGSALSLADSWITPLGDVKVDKDLSNNLSKKCDIVDVDDLAHSKEHSIEVQLPFLQVISKDEKWRFLPISLMLQDIETARQIGTAIMELIENSEDKFLIIGSSDLTHYETQERANRNDVMLLKKVASLDLSGFYTVLERHDISSCGYGAIAVVMQIAKQLGRKKGIVLKYATSGDVTGNKSSVVGYPSVRFV